MIKHCIVFVKQFRRTSRMQVSTKLSELFWRKTENILSHCHEVIKRTTTKHQILKLKPRLKNNRHSFENYSCHAQKFLAKIQNWWQKFIFCRKTFPRKVCLDTLNAVLKTLPRGLPDLHYQSWSFYCSNIIVHLIAKTWAGGFQFWWTSFFFTKTGIFPPRVRKL